MAHIGLRQEDIFTSVIERIITELTESQKESKEFSKIHFRLIENVLHLGMHETENFTKLITSTQACYGA